MIIGTITNGTGAATVGGVSAATPQPISPGQVITVGTAGTFVVNLYAGSAEAVSISATLTSGPNSLAAGSNTITTGVTTGTFTITEGAAGLSDAFMHAGKNNNISFLSGDDCPLLALELYNWAAVSSYVNGGYFVGQTQQRVMGAVSTSGTAVTAITGTVFNANWPAGTVCKINGVPYEIASVTSSSALVLSGVGAGTQTAVQFICDPPSSGIFQGFKEILAVFINPVNGYMFQFNPLTNCIQAYATGGTEASGANLSQMVTPMFVVGI